MSGAIDTVKKVMKKNTEQRQKEKEDKLAHEKRIKDAKRDEISAEIARIQYQMKQHQPVSFTMAVADSAIESGYNTLLDNKEYANKKLETLKDVKNATVSDNISDFVDFIRFACTVTSTL